MNHARIGNNKIKRIFLAALVFCAFGCILTGVLLLGVPNVARAAQNLNSGTNASLFLPASYENYLELSAPSSVAIGERYVAIADGKKIYVYDHMNPSKGYRVWEHKQGAEAVTVGKMQFTDDNRLFFLSVSGLFELNLGIDDLQEKKVSDDFIPYTFLIAEDALFAVTTNEGTQTVLYRFEMSHESFSLSEATKNITISRSSSEKSSPLLAYAGDTVYCSLNGTVYKYNDETLTGSGNFSLDNTVSSTLTPSSVCAIGDNLYFTDANGLHRADTKGNAELIESSKNINALYPRGDLLYCLLGNAVRAYDTKENAFTDYEISSASASVGRLSGATDVVRAGSLVVVADTANHRVTVYDSGKKCYSVIEEEDDFSPTLVATDGTVIAATSGNKVYVCKDPSKNPNFDEPVTADIGTIKGLACVHGNVYYITEYGYGKVEETDKGLVSRLEDPLEALAADDNGILYVVDSGGHVRYFYEDEFIDPAVMSGGDMELTLQMPISSLRADREGNLYYIHENEIWKNETPFLKIDDKFFAYGDESELISFALGFEDDEVFLLYGNHIIKTAFGALNIPTQGEMTASISRVEMLLPHEKGRRYYL